VKATRAVQLLSSTKRIHPFRVPVYYWNGQGDPRIDILWERRLKTKGGGPHAPQCYKTYNLQFERDLPTREDGGFFKIKNYTDGKEIYGQKLFSGFEDVPFCTRTDSMDLYAGWRKRLNPVMPVPNLVEIQRLATFTKKWVSEHLTPLPPLDNYSELFEEWLINNKSYNEERKKQLREAFKEVLTDGWSLNLTEFHYTVKGFPKREFYEIDKFLRWICSRTDPFKALVAPFIKKIEDQLYRYPYFIKHTPIHKLPHLLSKLRYKNWKLETDYSSFESGFNPYYTNAVECNLWRHMLKNNPLVMDAVLRTYYQNKTVWTRRHGHAHVQHFRVPRLEIIDARNCKAGVIGSRMSGEMWTSLGNGFSNLMNILYLFDKYHIKADTIFVEGDDGLFGLDEPILKEQDFENFGFKIKMQYEKCLNNTCFCGNLFDEEELNLIVPPEQTARLPWICSCEYLSKPKTWVPLTRAKALSGYCQGRCTPILAVFCDQIRKILGEGEMIFEKQNKWYDDFILQMSISEVAKPLNVTWNARMLYCQKFGIDIDTQFFYESLIRKAKTLQELEIPFSILNNTFGPTKSNFENYFDY